MPESQATTRSAIQSPPDSMTEFMAPRRGLPAWAMSGMLHFTIFIAACLLIRVAPRGADVESDRTGGIVLVRDTQAKREYLTEDEVQSGGTPTQASGIKSDNPLPTENDVPVDLAGALPSGQDLIGVGGGIGDAIPSAEGLIDGPKPTKFTGGKVQTGVFGVQGIGSKFVYVFDRSRSMSGYEGRPLAAAKAELSASLKSIQSTHQFQIVFYNQRTHVFNPTPGNAPQMMFGTDRDKELAIDFVSRVVADGSTEHMPALQLAMKMGPDVIFFLTDAEEPQLTDQQLAQIHRWNAANASINTIQFGAGPYKGDYNFLVKLARQNGGRHVYVDVTRLPLRR